MSLPHRLACRIECNLLFQILKYQREFIPLLRLLRDKTLSKRGYSWTGKLLSSLLLTLTHTYPLENKFVNPAEWNSKGTWYYKETILCSIFMHIQNSARIIIATGENAILQKTWRSAYLFTNSAGRSDFASLQISWHVPTKDEIELAIRIFKELVEPTLDLLEGLMGPGRCLTHQMYLPPTRVYGGVPRDAKWRNDFCRYAITHYPYLLDLTCPQISNLCSECVYRNSDTLQGANASRLFH